MFDIANIGKKADLSTGQWVDDIPNQPGLRLLVRSSNYKPYRVATAGLGRRSSKQLRSDVGFVEFSATAGKPMAEHLLLDWGGVSNDGKAVKHTPELALKLLTSDDDFGVGAEFRRAVEYAADHVAETLAEGTEEVAGN